MNAEQLEKGQVLLKVITDYEETITKLKESDTIVLGKDRGNRQIGLYEASTVGAKIPSEAKEDYDLIFINFKNAMLLEMNKRLEQARKEFEAL